jgi:hypothetical protein
LCGDWGISMELPITRPSMICYADEIEFAELLKDLSLKRHNGFIRITSGSEEGFVLFKQGKEIAASYDRHSRVEAIEKINDAMNNTGTLIEIFNVRPTQIDFFMDINKPYIIGSEAYELIDEIKKSTDLKETETTPEPKAVPTAKPVSEAIKQSENNTKSTKTTKPETIEIKQVPQDDDEIVSKEKSSNDSEILSETKEAPNEPIEKSELENKSVKDVVPEIIKPETKTKQLGENDTKEKQTTQQIHESVTEMNEGSVIESVPEKTSEEFKIEPVTDESNISSTDEPVPDIDSTLENDLETNSKKEKENSERPLIDRSELMKKYGIKDIQDEDVDNILESYKGGSVKDEDIEKIELTLMNKIKKSILPIPKIKGAEVMVFLENMDGLSGKVNIIIELESKGFLSRFMSDSKDINLERQIINISQIEIRKSFRKYPEIVDKFDVNVEIS